LYSILNYRTTSATGGGSAKGWTTLSSTTRPTLWFWRPSAMKGFVGPSTKSRLPRMTEWLKRSSPAQVLKKT